MVSRDESPQQRKSRKDELSKDNLDEALRTIQEAQRKFRARWGMRLSRALEAADLAAASGSDVGLSEAAGRLSAVVSGSDSDGEIIEAIMSELLAMAAIYHSRGDDRAEHVALWGRDLSDAEASSGDAHVIQGLERAVANDPKRIDLWQPMLDRARQNRARGMTLVRRLQELADHANATGDKVRARRIHIVVLALERRKH